MKRSGSGSLVGIFPVKRQTSSGQSGGTKKAEQGRETRRGLGLPRHSGRGGSLDALLAGLDSAAAAGEPEEVSSPPQRRPASFKTLPAPVKVEQSTVDLRPYPASPKANLAPDASMLSSPFAAWRHSSFQAGEDSGGEDGREGQGGGEETFDLGTPYAAGVGPSRSGGGFQLGAVPFLRRVEAAAAGAEPRDRGAVCGGAASPPNSGLFALPHHQQHRPDLWGPAVKAEAAPENDENSLSALISPARPPPRRFAAAPAMLLTPEKEGGLLPPPSGGSPPAASSPPAAPAVSIQPMPSLSSWMVPAAKPPPQRAAPSKESEAAVEEVLACLNFDPSQPRKMERAPSPLDRLLGDLGDSDFAPSLALWDEEHAQQPGAGAVTAAAQ